MDFESFFITEKEPFKGKSIRDKFLSRVFGIFSERIVRIWCQNPKAPFSDLGRPTIYYGEEGKYCILDFLLKDKKGELFVTEMKCEIEYQRYKFFTLSDPEQLVHHSKNAFGKFLQLGQDPNQYTVKVKGEEKPCIKGIALIWGRVIQEKKHLISSEYNINHILCLESITNDLLNWDDSNYKNFIKDRMTWAEELFNGLTNRVAKEE